MRAMGLKLFRTTEYSSSSLFTHTRPQAGLWPATLLVISGLWLAGPGNVALWRAVAIGTSGTGVLLAVALGAGIAAFVCALLSLVLTVKQAQPKERQKRKTLMLNQKV